MRVLMKKKLREFYARFISLNGDPRKISMGMAIGVFVGVTPTIPFHTIIIVMLIFIFRQNLTAALLGAWITNPITIPLFYATEYKLGSYLLGMQPCGMLLTECSMNAILRVGWNIFCPLQLGGIILAPIFAIPAYLITHKENLARKI
jgi:hypothetical protein